MLNIPRHLRAAAAGAWCVGAGALLAGPVLAQPRCLEVPAEALLAPHSPPPPAGFALTQSLCDLALVRRHAEPQAAATAASSQAIEPPPTLNPAAASATLTAPLTTPIAAPLTSLGPTQRQDLAGQARVRAVAPLVAQAAQRHDIDPLLLHAVAHVESRHQAQAVSPAGARGLMQVMPGTGREMGLADPRELLSPEANLEASARYLKLLQARFGNDLRLVLAAYNAGEGAVERHGRRVPPYAETQAYVRKVLAVYSELRRKLLNGGQA